MKTSFFRPAMPGALKGIGREKGVRTLCEDGVRRARAGETSLAEVFRVAFSS